MRFIHRWREFCQTFMFMLPNTVALCFTLFSRWPTVKFLYQITTCSKHKVKTAKCAQAFFSKMANIVNEGMFVQHNQVKLAIITPLLICQLCYSNKEANFLATTWFEFKLTWSLYIGEGPNESRVEAGKPHTWILEFMVFSHIVQLRPEFRKTDHGYLVGM